jgi:hypothetical protein
VGYPYVNNDLRWLLGQSSNQGVYQSLQSHLLAFGTDYIIQGCTEGGGTIAEGWVMLNSELLKVDSHTWGAGGYFEKVTTYDSTGNKTTRSGSSIQTYQKNRATATAVAGTLLYTGNRYKDVIRLANYTVTEQDAVGGSFTYILEDTVSTILTKNYAGGSVGILLPLNNRFSNKRVTIVHLEGNAGGCSFSDITNLTIPSSHFLNGKTSFQSLTVAYYSGAWYPVDWAESA